MNLKIKGKHRFRLPIGFLLFGIGFILVFTFSLFLGSVRMSVSEFFGALFFRSDETNSIILYSLRLPRILAAVVAGVGLSLSGVLLQGVTDNSLASPNVIGVNSGAGFGTVLCLAILPVGSSVLRFSLLPLFAFVFAVLTTLAVLAIASGVGGTGTSVLLSGVAVTALLNAFISAITLADTDVLSSYNSFSVGGFYGVTYEELAIPSAIIVVCLITALLLSKEIDLFCLGSDTAALLGVNVKCLSIICIVLASLSAAAVVSFAGLLGFVGLVVPHIARSIFGYRMRSLIPATAIIGATVTTLADLVGRVVIAPSEIPVGIMMAIVGAPFFIFLLIRRKRT